MSKGNIAIGYTALLLSCGLLCPLLCPAQEKAHPQAPVAAGLDDARRAIATADYPRAKAEVEAFVSGNPASAEGHSLLAYTLLRLNNPRASLEEYTRAAQLRAPSADELRYVAEDYALLDDYADAERWMRGSLQLNDRDPDTWYGLGRIEYTLQKFPKAVESFQQALTLAPRSVKVEDNLALAYEGLNREDDAIAAYRSALEWQKTSAHPSEQPMLNLAIILIRKGNLEEADGLLEQAVKIAPNDPQIRQQLGHIYIQQKRFDKAQVEFERAVSLEPDNASFHFLLGRVYQHEGMKEKAGAEFERAALLKGGKSEPAGP